MSRNFDPRPPLEVILLVVISPMISAAHIVAGFIGELRNGIKASMKAPW